VNLTRYRISLCLLCLVLLAPATAPADSFFTYGVSPRTIGMGNAFVATADDWTAPYYNPGGVCFNQLPILGGGYMANFHDLHFIGIDAPRLDEARAMVFGVNMPIPFRGGWFKERLSFGITGYLPEGRLLQMNVSSTIEPNLILLQNSHRTNAMYPAFSIKVLSGLGIGGGVQTFLDTIGEINAFIDPAGNVQTEVGEELLITFSPTFGALFKPGEHWAAMRGWTFGFTYRNESYTDYLIPVAAVLDQIPFIIRFKATSIFTPRQYVLGAAYAAERWRIEADGSFNEWSRFPDPNLIIDIDVQIPIIPIEFMNSIKRPPKYHDTFTGRAGVEGNVWDHRHFDLMLRGGYAFDPTPVPPQRGYTNQLDADRHIGSVSTGIRWTGVGDKQFRAPITLDLVYQAHYLPERISYKNEGTDTANPGYPKIGMEGWLHFIGASVSASFDYK